MKAYLVTIYATTRIVVNSDENPNNNPGLSDMIRAAAVRKILESGEIENYINIENADFQEDTECPAGEFELDEFIAL